MAFDAASYNRSAYGAAWANLNTTLAELHRRDGLAAALLALQRQQRDCGFVPPLPAGEALSLRLPSPCDPTRWFALQHNVQRAQRYAGAGRRQPPEGACACNGGCVLDPDNVRWQQRGLQIGYALTLAGEDCVAWANPFPLKPVHLVVATREHRAQQLGAGSTATRAALVSQLLELADALPGFVAFFNGPGAGASIEAHAHFQVFQRALGDGRFPLERAAAPLAPGVTQVLLPDAYPATVLCRRGPRSLLLEPALRWIDAWRRICGDAHVASGNLVATRSGDAPAMLDLYFVPRIAVAGASVASLELLGEMVVADGDAARPDYTQVWQQLAAASPGAARRLAPLAGTLA